MENDLEYVGKSDRKGNAFLGHVGAALPMVRRAMMAVGIAVTFPGSTLSDAKKDAVSLVRILILTGSDAHVTLAFQIRARWVMLRRPTEIPVFQSNILRICSLPLVGYNNTPLIRIHVPSPVI